MPLDYNPKDASNTWPDGDYDAELKKVEDRLTGDGSKNPGQPMQHWSFTIYNNDGKTITVSEYVTMSALFKVRDLAKALGRKADFEAGKFQADDYVGSSLRVTLKTEKSDGFDDKNKIGRFLQAESNKTPAPKRERLPVSSGPGFKEDEIPF